MIKPSVVVLFVLTLVSACMFPAPVATPVAPATPVARATPTLPSPPPAIAAIPPTVEPLPGFDPTLYLPAMRPEFASDVDRLGLAPRYNITLSVDLDALQVAGREQVRYTNLYADPLGEIYFRLFPSAPGFGGAMTVTRVLLDGQVMTPQLEQRGTALKVPVTLAPGASADLALDFYVSIPRSPTVGYAMFGVIDGMTTLPNVYPVIPVRDENGWHVEVAPEYGDETFTPTALYDVSITAPASQVVVASGTCQTPAAGRWRCVSGPMRDFMLAMSADYEVATQTVEGVNVRSFYLPGDQAGGEHALKVAADALRVFSRRFGAYPFAELDVVESGTRAGGIEYPGLVVIAESLYSLAGEGSYFDFVVAHEVAHQWWYSLVGNDQVNHPWLDESLTNYSTILYYQDVFGKTVADQVLAETFEAPYQRLVQERRDQKVDQPVAAFTRDDYSAVVYRKGPLFFHALRQAIGDDKFDAFLKAYFRQNRYEVASAERMLVAAESVADRATVRSLFGRWIQSAATPQ